MDSLAAKAKGKAEEEEAVLTTPMVPEMGRVEEEAKVENTVQKAQKMDRTEMDSVPMAGEEEEEEVEEVDLVVMVNGMKQTVKEDMTKDVEEVENMVTMMTTVMAKEGGVDEVDEVEVKGEEGALEVHPTKVIEKGGTVVAGAAEVADVEEGEEVMIHTMKMTVAEAVGVVVDVEKGEMEVTILMALTVMAGDAEDAMVVEVALMMRMMITPVTAKVAEVARMAEADLVMKVTKKQNGRGDAIEE